MNIEVENKENFIWIAQQQSSDYYVEFVEALQIIKPRLSRKEFDNLLKHKLQFSSPKFDEAKYLQYAVEFSVLRYFAEHFIDTFKYEYNANPENNTDVDCRIEHNGFTYNIEVKTPVLKKKDVDLSPGLLGRSLGRLPSELFQSISKTMDRALNIEEGSSKMINFDNKLMQFLIDSNVKFNDRVDETNILIIGLDDIDEIILWSSYLTNEGNGGLFTNNSFAKQDDYKNVDFVVFTNLLYKHENGVKNMCTGHWDLKDCFSVMYNNPRVNHQKKDSLIHFGQICPNYNYEIANYKVIRDNEPDIAKSFFKLKFFVQDELEKKRNLYLFDKK